MDPPISDAPPHSDRESGPERSAQSEVSIIIPTPSPVVFVDHSRSTIQPRNNDHSPHGLVEIICKTPILQRTHNVMRAIAGKPRVPAEDLEQEQARETRRKKRLRRQEENEREEVDICSIDHDPSQVFQPENVTEQALAPYEDVLPLVPHEEAIQVDSCDLPLVQDTIAPKDLAVLYHPDEHGMERTYHIGYKDNWFKIPFTYRQFLMTRDKHFLFRSGIHTVIYTPSEYFYNFNYQNALVPFQFPLDRTDQFINIVHRCGFMNTFFIKNTTLFKWINQFQPSDGIVSSKVHRCDVSMVICGSDSNGWRYLQCLSYINYSQLLDLVAFLYEIYIHDLEAKLWYTSLCDIFKCVRYVQMSAICGTIDCPVFQLAFDIEWIIDRHNMNQSIIEIGETIIKAIKDFFVFTFHSRDRTRIQDEEFMFIFAAGKDYEYIRSRSIGTKRSFRIVVPKIAVNIQTCKAFYGYMTSHSQYKYHAKYIDQHFITNRQLRLPFSFKIDERGKPVRPFHFLFALPLTRAYTRYSVYDERFLKASYVYDKNLMPYTVRELLHICRINIHGSNLCTPIKSIMYYAICNQRLSVHEIYRPLSDYSSRIMREANLQLLTMQRQYFYSIIYACTDHRITFLFIIGILNNSLHDPLQYAYTKDDQFDREWAKQLFLREVSNSRTPDECFAYMKRFFVGVVGASGSTQMTMYYITQTPTSCCTQELPLFSYQLIKQNYVSMVYSFMDLTVNALIPAPNKKDPLKMKEKSFHILKEYVISSQFKKYDYTCFTPEQILGAPLDQFDKAFNLYCGLPINRDTISKVYKSYQIPRDYDYTTNTALSLMLNHIREVLCNDNDLVYDYVLDWLSYIVQNPGHKTQVMLVFVGPSGCGKSTFYSWLMPIFGEYMENIRTASLGSQFVGMNFNEKFIIAIDEWNIRELDPRTADGLLKNIVTDPRMRVEAKFVQAHSIQSHNNLIASTNFAFNIAPSSVGYFRRLMIVKCGNTKPPQYFKDMHNMIGDPSRHKLRFSLHMHLFAKYLYDRPIHEFKPQNFPITDYQIKILTNTWKPYMKWWYEVMQRGFVLNEVQFDIYKHNPYPVGTHRPSTCHLLQFASKNIVQFYPPGTMDVWCNSLVDTNTYMGLSKASVYDAFVNDLRDRYNIDAKRTSYSITQFFHDLSSLVPMFVYSQMGRENMVMMPPFETCIKTFYSQNFAHGLRISNNPFKIYLGKDQEHQHILNEIETELIDSQF